MKETDNGNTLTTNRKRPQVVINSNPEQRSEYEKIKALKYYVIAFRNELDQENLAAALIKKEKPISKHSRVLQQRN